MSEEQPQDQLYDLWRAWVENPWIQGLVDQQKLWWASNPMSRLIPLDVEEVWRALVRLGDDLITRPDFMRERTSELLRQYNELMLWTMQRLEGEEAPADELVMAGKKDRRFQDQIWTNNLLFSIIKQAYLILSQWLLTTAEQMRALDTKRFQQANFYIRQFVDALSPANYALTNPAVLRDILETGGENLHRGMQNLLDDLQRGEIKVAGKEQFQVGKDLALSPGEVVLRNELIELIQYTPSTEQVYSVPLLIVPPWINKYYIMDIRPGRSMVEYLVQQGFTVFLISWRNPDVSLAHLTMDDYLRLGPLAAVTAAKTISESPKVHLVGYCIGGTLLAITLAYLAAAGDRSAASGSFFTSLQDFEEVGETAVFISEEYVTEIEKRMDAKGYLDAIEMGSIFRLLRSNDLIWNFVVNNYLLGREPLPFDLMYWSVDGTRMPRAMHAFYLRNMYLENNLIKPEHLNFLGQPIDLGRVTCSTYVVAGGGDHIVPWQSAHRAWALFSGRTRLVLSHGGHISSIINAPSKQKGHYFVNDADKEAADPDRWLKNATRHEGSWWPDWVTWLRRRSGKKRKPLSMGNEDYLPLVSAPGTYVLED